MNGSAMKHVLLEREDDTSEASRLPGNPWENPDFDAPVRHECKSRFQDDTWEQPVTSLSRHRAEGRIKFDADLGSGERLTDPHLRELLWACKCYVWNLIHEEGKGAPKTVRSSWLYLLCLVRWMRQYSYDAFGELDEDAVLDYVHHVNQADTTPLGKANRLKALRKLYHYQDRLPEGSRLLVHPFGGDWYPNGFAPRSLGSIPFIPDEVIIPVLTEARLWIEQYSADIIRLTEEVGRIGVPSNRGPDYGRKSSKRAAAIRSFRPSPGIAGNWFSRPLTAAYELYALHKRIQSAAIIIIGCFAGPRLHEILSLEPGCIRGPVKSEDGCLDIFYIKGATVKVSPNTFGHAREWVAGARPAGVEERMDVVEAVRVLEAIHRAVEPTYPKLIFTALRDMGPTYVTLSHMLRDFFGTVPASKHWSVSSHQFRKTFARFVSRYDSRHNAALSQQLGHVRLAMTDAYAAKDLDLVRLLEREHAEMVSEGFMALLSAKEMAGKKGEEIVRSVARLRAKIADEAEFIAICGRLGRDADIVLHLGEHGACYFRQSAALCGGVKAPNLAVRTPSMCLECENLVVTEDHRPFWERRVQDNQRLLQDYPDALPALRDKWATSLGQATRLLAKLAESRQILSR
jgi:hypothetical protein